ncbi:MAG: Holliday junction branch migration protein RuvA [Bacilli bacterium]|nr:Holliday junction branch migration protein RuvA [Bacilli bacterium]
MIYYLKGKVVAIDEMSIAVELSNGVAYECLVSHVDNYVIGQEVLIYTYEVIREDEEYIVGFSSKEEKSIFMSLIKVKGLGPKTVIQALSTTTPEAVTNAIASNNVAFLKKLPGIGQKAAAQIILDLKGQLTGGSKGNPKVYEEAYDALKALGFKGAQIDRVLAEINEPNATTEDIIRIALGKLRK